MKKLPQTLPLPGSASSLLVVVDRGGLKAYGVETTSTRGPHLRLVQSFEIPSLNRLSSTNHTTATTDWPEMELEESRCLCRQLGKEINRVVRQTAVNGWSLAAPKSIYEQIVSQLAPEVRERIVEKVVSDLRKIPPSRLRQHFRSLQPI